MMATDLANVRAFFHLLPIEFSLPVVLVARLAKRTIFGLFEKWELMMFACSTNMDASGSNSL
jgi:hypothetical protein